MTVDKPIIYRSLKYKIRVDLCNRSGSEVTEEHKKLAWCKIDFMTNLKGRPPSHQTK